MLTAAMLRLPEPSITKSGIRPRDRKIGIGCGVFGILVGGLVLGGWMFDIQMLKSLNPHWVAMKANTALTFLILVIGIFHLTSDQGLVVHVSSQRAGESWPVDCCRPLFSFPSC